MTAQLVAADVLIWLGGCLLGLSLGRLFWNTGTKRDPASRRLISRIPWVARRQRARFLKSFTADFPEGSTYVRHQLAPDDPLYGMKERLAKTSDESRQALLEWIRENP